MLKIKNLFKEYENGENPLAVLNDISLEIKDGEFIVVLGPSGSGKSTLLNAMSGLTAVKSGTIENDGWILQNLTSELTLFRRNIPPSFFNRTI